MTETSDTVDDGPDGRFTATLTKRYEDKLQSVVMALSELAREVARQGKAQPDTLNDDGQDDYLLAAERALHALHWGIANLNADRLVSTAADAHSAVRGRWK